MGRCWLLGRWFEWLLGAVLVGEVLVGEVLVGAVLVGELVGAVVVGVSFHSFQLKHNAVSYSTFQHPYFLHNADSYSVFSILIFHNAVS